MSRLFVANCTRQVQEVYYRLDFNADGAPEPNARFQPAKRQTIPPGRQIVLGGDLHIKQIEDIVDQLAKYGAVGTLDVPRLKKVAPYVCNVDKSVPVDVIRNVMTVNAGVLTQQGRDRRKKAAIAVDDTVANVVNSQFAEAGIPKEADQSVEVEFEQEEQSEAGEKRVEEGYRIEAKAKKGGRSRRK